MFYMLVATLLLAQGPPVTCPSAALTEAQVLDLVKGGLPDARIVQIAGTCHIGFFPSVGIIDEMAKQGVSAAVLEAIRNDGFRHITLAQAHAEVAALEKKTQLLAAASDEERDAALSRLDADDQQLRNQVPQSAPQGKFENDNDFEARTRKFAAQAAERDRRHQDDRNRIAAQYASGLSAQVDGMKRHIAELKQRTFTEEGTKLDFIDYDANRRRLMANLNGTEYWFTIPNDRAQEMYGRWSTVRVERGLEEDPDRTRSLADPAQGEVFTGIPREVAEANARVAALEKERKRREVLERVARVAWVDESTGLIWTRQDNGSDIDWNNAASYCRNLTLGEYRDWRLPEIGELQGIYDVSQADHIKGGIRRTGYWEWSATRNGSGEAWNLNFSAGTRHSDPLSTSDNLRALCVRRAGE